MKESAESEKSINIYTDASSSDESLLLHEKSKNGKAKKISIVGLFRYSNTSEKVMILFGVLGSIAQGLSLPLMINVMSKLINLFISLAASVAIRNLTGVQNNDKLIMELLDVLTGKGKVSYGAFFDQHKEFDPKKFTRLTASANAFSNDINIATLFKTKDEFWGEFHHYLIIIALIILFSFIGSFLMDGLLNISAMRQVTRIRLLTFKSILKQDIEWHEKTSPGELSSRIISDSMLIEDGMGAKIGDVIQNLITFIFCFVLAFRAGWKLSLYMSVTFPIILVLGTSIAIILKITTKKSQDVFAELGGIAHEAFTQIRTIVSFGTEQKEIDRYVKKLGLTKKYGIIMGNGLGMVLGLVFGVIFASFSIAFIYGTRFIRDGDMIYGDVLSVFMGILLGSTSLSDIAISLGAFSQATGAAVTIFDIIEREPVIKPQGGLSPSKPLNGTIEFQDVHFNYPSRPDVKVLNGVSFKCLPGQTVAVVGASGSGKSTLVQLLERFYNKNSGKILIDGKDIEEYNVSWLRSQIGLVSQEPTLFDDTVANNIAINLPNATRDQIEEAAKLAYAHNFIKKLSKGYDTNTGERGLQLSGGQKQRICIARALINHPKILLLDEATSALDNQSEKIVQAALESAASGRTTLVIAHRLSTVKNADLIIVMEKGNIVESGTHAELMNMKKHYYNLVKNQEIEIKEEDDTKTKDPDAIQELPYNDISLPNHRESTNITTLSRITSAFTSLSRRQTTGGFSDLSSSDESMQSTGIQDMPWRKYLNYNKPYWFNNFLGFIGAFFNGIVQPAFAYILSSALSVFTKQGDELINGGFHWGMMFIGLGFCNFLAYNFKFGRFFVTGECICYDLRKDLYNSIIRQEVGFFDTNNLEDDSVKTTDKKGHSNNKNNTNSGVLIAKLATEATLVRKLNSAIGSIFQLFITIIAGLVIAFINNWKLTLILIISVPLIAFGSYISAKSMKTKNRANKDSYEVSSKIACEAIASIKSVYSLNLSDYFTRIYGQKLNEPTKHLEGKALLGALGIGFSNSVTYMVYMVGFWVGAIFMEKGDIDFGSMFKVIMALVLTAMEIGKNSTTLTESIKSIEAFIRINDIIERTPKIDARDPSGMTKEADKFKGELKLCDLRFRYPSRPNVTVLRMGNQSIDIPAGKTCAFVGASGSGKSTIIGLIPRWYDANHGSVFLDKIENKEYNIKWLRKQIGIVNQEPCLFNISIKENIKYGKLDATDEEVIEAAKKANIHKFIMSLPEKYDTIVGGLGTSQMSGGQKQRIAIARAMIRNPKILLLDEATSALDAESELIVQKALDEASEGRTTIIIAHRLSTIKNVDMICVFKDGKIIEQGKHEDLMEKKGEYYNMVMAGDGVSK